MMKYALKADVNEQAIKDIRNNYDNILNNLNNVQRNVDD